ncbi:MAG: CotH kinase family protein [Bacteroidia bacterium]|nr:CotH kinase family protein [Bacteroidia bacterium]
MKNTFVLIFILFFYQFSFSQVKINEYSCANFNLNDNFGNPEDWIELYNPTSSPVSLSGFYLSDMINKPTKWKFGAGVTIPANGFLRIWASGRNINSGANLHTNFKLTQTKPEAIILRDPSLNIVDSIVLRRTQKNHSYGRTTDGALTWNVFDTPTPNASNNTSTPKTYCPRPVMSFTPGFYSSPISVSISIPTSYTVHYTLDGSTPTTASSVYSSPILISSTTVLRARAFSSNPTELPSFVESNTYFINVSHSVAVVSVFGDQVQSLLNGNSSLEPETGLEYFDVNHVFKTESYGTSNKHGNDSWSYPQRGIDFVSRDQYGYNYALRAKLFPNKSRKEFQRIILKAGASDNYPFECPAAGNPYAWGDPSLLDGAHIRDAFIHTLSQKAKLHLDERTWSPGVMYLNGQYWGVYEIREKVDDIDFTEYYYDADIEDSLYVLKTWGGTWAEYGGAAATNDWNNLKNFILSNNMAIPSNFNYVDSLYDVKSLADYVILNSLSVNSDWLNWNTMWWRGINTNSKQKKWKYTLWDMDATFHHYINYTGIPNLGANADPCDPQSLPDPGGQGHVPILNALLQNPNFKQYYIMRYFDLLNGGLSCQRMVTVLDSMINLIAPEMTQHCNKWGGSYSAWYSNYQALRNFILQRCDSVLNGFSSCYNTTGPFKIKVNVFPPNAGIVQVNSLMVNNFVWSANYPGNLNMIFKAIPNSGYCFDKWEFQNHTPSPGIINDSVTVNLTTTDSIVARFVSGTQTPSVTASSPYICQGEDIQLQISGGSGSTIQWQTPASLSCYTCPITIVSPTANTSVSVTVQGNCTNGTTVYNIKVYPRPALITPVTNPSLCIPASVQVELKGGVNYSWTPSAGLSCYTCSNPSITIEQTTTYTITTATDPNFRCSDTKTLTVIVDGECPDIFVPTGFSPNGDNHNDFFRIYGPINDFQVVIYNRWGEKVFESNNMNDTWDGKYQGDVVPSGIYAYILTGKNVKGESIKKTGNITVIR